MARTNAPTFWVPESAARQVKVLVQYSEKLNDVLEESKALPIGVSVYQVLYPLSERIGIPYKDLEDIFSSLENIKFLGTEYRSSEEAIERLVAGLPPDLSQLFNEKKPEIISALSIYGDNNPVSAAFKAQRLAYLFERIYRDSEIITDIRPIFNDSGENVIELLISHSLVITFSSATSNERLHFTMDAGDVLKLRDACDRAILKASSLKKTLGALNKDWVIEVLRDNNGI